jgi:hypothetical protein
MSAAAVAELIDRATAAGLELIPAGGKLRVRGPEPLPPDLIAELRQRKAELLAILAGDPPPPYDPFTDPRPALPEVRAAWALMEDADAAGFRMVRAGPFASFQPLDGSARAVPAELCDRLLKLSIGAVVRALTRRPWKTCP